MDTDWIALASPEVRELLEGGDGYDDGRILGILAWYKANHTPASADTRAVFMWQIQRVRLSEPLQFFEEAPDRVLFGDLVSLARGADPMLEPLSYLKGTSTEGVADLACYALACFGGEASLEIIAQRVAKRPSRVLTFALGRTGNPAAIDHLASLIRSPAPFGTKAFDESLTALRAIGLVGTQAGIDVLVRTLEHPNVGLRYEAAATLTYRQTDCFHRTVQRELAWEPQNAAERLSLTLALRQSRPLTELTFSTGDVPELIKAFRQAVQGARGRDRGRGTGEAEQANCANVGMAILATGDEEHLWEVIEWLYCSSAIYLDDGFALDLFRRKSWVDALSVCFGGAARDVFRAGAFISQRQEAHRRDILYSYDLEPVLEATRRLAKLPAPISTRLLELLTKKEDVILASGNYENWPSAPTTVSFAEQRSLAEKLLDERGEGEV